jgi:hypothetical protein
MVGGLDGFFDGYGGFLNGKGEAELFGIRVVKLLCTTMKGSIPGYCETK